MEPERGEIRPAASEPPLPPAPATTLGARLVVRYQPILDVARGVAAGYQVRAELPSGDPTDDPDGFRTASVASIALDGRAALPPNTFLSLPIGADVAASAVVGDVLDSHGSLAGVVLDVIGFSSSSPPELDTALARYRSAGAIVSVGGHGASQPELTSIVRLRPAILRLGRDWVRDVDTSGTKRSAIETIGRLAGHVDAWILAEGVSSAGELRALAELDVPLAQGEFVGRPGQRCDLIDPAVLAALPAIRPPTDGLLAGLVQPVFTTHDPSAVTPVLPETSGLELMVLVDADHRPVSILQRSAGSTWVCFAVLAVNVDTPPADVVSRAMMRPRPERFTPLACTDDEGRLLGILRIERLVERLTR